MIYTTRQALCTENSIVLENFHDRAPRATAPQLKSTMNQWSLAEQQRPMVTDQHNNQPNERTTMTPWTEEKEAQLLLF
jgi:hypothetical protein